MFAKYLVRVTLLRVLLDPTHDSARAAALAPTAHAHRVSHLNGGCMCCIGTQQANVRPSIKALGDGFMEKSFSVTVTYSDTNVPVQVNRLIGCRITSSEGGGSQGTDPLEVSLDLSIFRVETDGLNAVSGILT